MIDTIKEYWQQFVAGAVILIAYGTQSQQLRNYKEKQASDKAELLKKHQDLRIEFLDHVRSQNTASLVTTEELTHRQMSCQKMLVKELAHIRELLETRLSNVEKDIDEIKFDLKNKP